MSVEPLAVIDPSAWCWKNSWETPVPAKAKTKVKTKATTARTTERRPENAGPHGFSEILYGLTSQGNNNGSDFGGLTGNTSLIDGDPYQYVVNGASLRRQIYGARGEAAWSSPARMPVQPVSLEEGIVAAIGGMPTTSRSPHPESVVVAFAPFETSATSLTGRVIAPLETVSVFVNAGVELVAAIVHFST
jgi:hypothetical protein